MAINTISYQWKPVTGKPCVTNFVSNEKGKPPQYSPKLFVYLRTLPISCQQDVFTAFAEI